ncbi:MAG: cupin domain-containing protein [Proteobacteria bacterium]|jgi:mannose-6-phosphate isomerase-like protein (cupin superfamily)|nr:cupin domain-containing protein [Pseudomonadota bacterium]
MSSRSRSLEAELRRRVITPADFVADASAFVDVHLPRSSGKTSFSFIGAGVTQNEDAATNLVEPHGFCVGAAGLAPGMVNNAHLHYTAEVFVCLTGTWKMMIGLDDRQSLVLGPGDVFSVPTWVFRSFENVGSTDGFLYTFLGGDDPGGILWSPRVLELARESGLVLDKSEKVTKVADVPAGSSTLRPVSPQAISQVDRYTDDEIESRVVRRDGRLWQQHALLTSVLPGHLSSVAPVIGVGFNQHRRHHTAITYPHGFSVNWLRIEGKSSLGRHRVACPVVLLALNSDLVVELGDSDTACREIPAGSVVSLPAGEWRDVRNPNGGTVEVLVASQGDGRCPIEWSLPLVNAAREHGFVVDANGCVAPRSLVERNFG